MLAHPPRLVEIAHSQGLDWIVLGVSFRDKGWLWSAADVRVGVLPVRSVGGDFHHRDGATRSAFTVARAEVLLRAQGRQGAWCVRAWGAVVAMIDSRRNGRLFDKIRGREADCCCYCCSRCRYFDREIKDAMYVKYVPRLVYEQEPSPYLRWISTGRASPRLPAR